MRLDLDEQQPSPSALEQWAIVRDTSGLEFPSIPYFRDGDSKLSLTGSTAICRFLGQKYRPKMVGSAMNEYAEVDALLCMMQDMRYDLDRTVEDPTAERRAAAMKHVGEQLERINRFMRSKAWLSGKQVSIADFIFCELLEYILFIDGTAIDSFPHLKKLLHKFNTIPEIAKYKETQGPFEPKKYFAIPALTGR